MRNFKNRPGKLKENSISYLLDHLSDRSIGRPREANISQLTFLLDDTKRSILLIWLRRAVYIRHSEAWATRFPFKLINKRNRQEYVVVETYVNK